MGITALHTLYAVNIATAEDVDVFIDQITDQNVTPGIEMLLAGGDGDIYNTFAAIGEQKPQVKFTTTDLKAALDGAALTGLKISSDVDDDGLEMWFRQVDQGGTRKTGSNHTKLTINEGILVPTTISAQHNQPATLAYDAHCTYDGTNEPIVIAASEALEGTASVSNLWTLGPVMINGTALEGVQSLDIQFGMEVIVVGSDGEVWPTFACIGKIAPTVKITSTDVSALSTYGLDGTAQGATDSVIYLRKLDKGGTRVANVTEEHISLTVDEGMITVEEVSGSHGQHLSATVTITPTYDGTNAPFVLDTTAAIA